MDRIRRLRLAKDAMDRDWADPELDLDVVAAHAGCSRYHFLRASKEAYGKTPGRCLTHRRIERAEEMLRSTNLTVTEICTLVGFSSLGRFSSLGTFFARFKTRTGLTPSGYRTRHVGRGAALIPGCYASAPPPALPTVTGGLLHRETGLRGAQRSRYGRHALGHRRRQAAARRGAGADEPGRRPGPGPRVRRGAEEAGRPGRALTDQAAQDVPAPDTGTLRGDLRALAVATFEAAQRPPAAPALRTLVREAARGPHLAELMRTFTESRRAAVHEILERGRQRGERPADRDPGLLVDQFYGLFCYRFLLEHAPRDADTAIRLADSLLD